MRRERASRADFAFVQSLRVRWSEVDAQGVVFNPNYFVYADIGMTEYMRAIGAAYPGSLTSLGTDLFAVHAEADYLASATYDDVLELTTRVAYIGSSSLRYLTALWRGEELLTELRLTYVHTRLSDKRPAPVPEALIAKIEQFERVAPLRK